MTSKKRLSVLALVALTFQLFAPTLVSAAGCTVSALDTVAGLGTQVSVSGCLMASTTLVVKGPGTSDYTQTVALDASGNAVTLVPSKYVTTAGTYQVTAAGTSAAFKVIADRADDAHSSLTVSPTVLKAGGSATATAVLRDKYDNPVAGRPMALIGSRISDDISARSSQSDESGRFLWSIVASTPGDITLIPYDIVSGRQLKLRADITVTGGSSFSASLTGTERGGDVYAADLSGDLAGTTIDHFEILPPQGVTNIKANELFSMTIRAMRGTEVVRGYVGTVIVESSDPDAELPKKGEDLKTPNTGRVDFRDIDQGERKVPLSFVLRKKGPQTIHVYDKSMPAIDGIITLDVQREDGDGSGTIEIVSPKDRSRIKGYSVNLQGRAPSLVNLTVKGGKQSVSAESDTEGVFRVTVPLNEQDNEATLFVTSENGTYESEPVHIIIDNEAPKIDTITFDPAEGKTTDPATIVVKSEPELGSVTATIESLALTLTETGSGLYKAAFAAPAQDKIYDVTIVATDSVGNQSTLLSKWTVKPKNLPVVQGVTAEGQPMQVKVDWQAVTGMEVKEYKIYIAKDADPKNYLYSVSTGKPVTSAVIKDLPLGETYQFSLTAISTEGGESPEKSKPATASPQGIRFSAKPGDSSLLLEWTKIKDLPLNSYMLEYGVEAGQYTEKRTINGEATSYMLRDLLNGVTYELRLTPVTVTGKTMTELSAVTQGTPGGSGFKPGADEPVPPDVLDKLHPGANLDPLPNIDDIPSTPGSGVPPIAMAAAVVLAAVIGYQWQRIRKQNKMTQEFLHLMNERYHQ